MLVLSRKVGETIQIGSDICITVTRVQGGRVQIGIMAPRDVAIRRGELGMTIAEPQPRPMLDLVEASLQPATPGLDLCV